MSMLRCVIHASSRPWLIIGALVAVTLLAAPAAGVASTSGPLVRIADRQPLTLSGLRFKPNERVVLHVSLDEKALVQKVRATAGGTFRVVFATSYDRCSVSLGLKAIGAGGSRVAWKLQSLDCPVRDRVEDRN